MNRLAAIIAKADALLFDFDGPLCDVFAGRPAPEIAAELGALANRLTGKPIAADTSDPHEVLKRSGEFPYHIVKSIEDELTKAELEAVHVSKATPHGIDSIRACLASNRHVGIVSNNASCAISQFLQQNGLDVAVSPVIGRPYADPSKMKPDPTPLKMALDELRIDPTQATLIGDSLTDIQASRALGVASIAYANKPGKRALLKDANAVIDDMEELEVVLKQFA